MSGPSGDAPIGLREQRSWILDSYLRGEQDSWALIDNSDADDVRHNLETAIERLRAVETARQGWEDSSANWQKFHNQQHDRAKVAEAEVERLSMLVFLPTGDNHHNAAMCPYCSPGGADLGAQLRVAKREVDRQAAAIADVIDWITTFDCGCFGGTPYQDPEMCDRCQMLQRLGVDLLAAAALANAREPTASKEDG